MNLHTLTYSVPYSWMRVAEHGRYEAVGAGQKWKENPYQHQNTLME